MSTAAATIVITTHNRKAHLRNAILSALEQIGDNEVLVIADACVDGTIEMVRREFPQVRLEVSDERRGLIVQRNRAARISEAPVLVSIDDDVILPSRDIVARALACFDHPRIGAVALPHINFIGDRTMPWFPVLPDANRRWISRTFVGCGSALRRDVFLQLGGYHEHLFHWGEEVDYCMRLLDAGMAVQVSDGHPIHHFPVQQDRHTKARNIYLQRNSILNHWYSAPTPFLPGLLVREAFAAFGRSLARRELLPLQSMVLGWIACWHKRHDRRPVQPAAVRLFLALRKRQLAPLDEIEPLLAEIAGARQTLAVAEPTPVTVPAGS
ncbi:MAG: glycosyltransferase [Phycisphaerales bacterium]|nr:glycosyltransferase [Phycisphaerales bacterium]